MLRIALGLLLVSAVAALLGFGGVAASAAGIARSVFVVTLVIGVVLLVGAMVRHHRPV
ncbi:MAG: DUF1328 family protein [Gemmatimonadales bacterium]